MKFMNQLNVVHRDLKIENTFVKTKQGSSKKESFDDFEFKFADLVLAKAVTSTEHMT